MSLAALFSEPEKILGQWPKGPLRTHQDPSEFKDLLTLEEVNELIDLECVAMRNIVLIDSDGGLIDRRKYGESDAGLPYRGAVKAHLKAGGTVSFRQLRNLKPSLAQFTRALQRDTGCLAHVNAYMTPARSQGLRYHYDPYVTVIVQVAGRKVWPVHDPIVVNPTREYDNYLERGFTHEERVHLANTPPVAEYVLEPGDVFWLPRGYLHSPHNDGDATSLHLTFALQEPTRHWAAEQMVRALLKQALHDPEVRAVLPPGELLGGSEDDVVWARNYLLGLITKADISEVAAYLREVARESTPA